MSYRRYATCGCGSCRPIEPLGMTGFSAQRPPSQQQTSFQLGNWVFNDSFYNGQGFDPVSGTYTVPETGRYSVKAIVSYRSTITLTVSIGSGVNPAFQIRKIGETTPLISSLLPVLNVGAVLLTLRAILGSATVTLVGDLELQKGEQIGLFFNSSGLNILLDIGGVETPGTVWSVHRIA